MARDGKRVELVDDPEPQNSLVAYIGLGLIASVIVGFAPLSDAVKGNGTFESAMTRFLACFAVCVVAGAIIGRLLDSAPPAGTTEGDGDAADESVSTDGDEPTPAGDQGVDLGSSQAATAVNQGRDPGSPLA